MFGICFRAPMHNCPPSCDCAVEIIDATCWIRDGRMVQRTGISVQRRANRCPSFWLQYSDQELSSRAEAFFWCQMNSRSLSSTMLPWESLEKEAYGSRRRFHQKRRDCELWFHESLEVKINGHFIAHIRTGAERVLNIILQYPWQERSWS